MLKKTIIALYIVVIVVMAIATIIEKYEGTAFVTESVYGAWWFSALWALLTAAAVFYFIKRRVRRPSVVCLHLSFVVILAGALLTHLTARQGIIHLRLNETTDSYTASDNSVQHLPFTVTLQQFQVQYHEGTQAPSDYLSTIVIGSNAHSDKRSANGNDGTEHFTVSMNNIVSFHGVRLYQSSYDDDLQGSFLSVNSDPWGIPVTYTGYALLFISLLWILIDPRGAYRQLLRRVAATTTSTAVTRMLAVALLSSTCCYGMASPRVLPTETADRFASLFIVYNDRVCPMETYAIDFTKKLCGKRHYDKYSATQILTGFIFFYDDWTKEPIIKVKGSEMKQRLGLSDQVSFNSLFNHHGYVLGPYLQDKDVRKLDEKVSLIIELHQGSPLKIFPYTETNDSLTAIQQAHHTSSPTSLTSRLTWYSPTDVLPDSMDTEHRKYIREVFTLLNGEIQAGRFDRANIYLDKMLEYQKTFGAKSLPSATRVTAEHIYNKVPFATILFMVCLTVGFVSFLIMLFLSDRRAMRWFHRLQRGLLFVSCLALSVCLCLRWIITGHVPMTNGYETMLFLAWAVMLLAMLTSRRFPIMLTFGMLLSGFFLLVSHISQMDPQISHLMPVLNSPLLTLHVSIIMMAYALLSLTFISSLTALLTKLRGKAHSEIATSRSEQMYLLSQTMLYPAITCLGFGIFIGAIWANVSWGTYWSWDPKETWALITFLVYAIPAHRTLKTLHSNLPIYHLFMVLAFLTLLMTYFGVNYFLGGMHSYA